MVLGHTSILFSGPLPFRSPTCSPSLFSPALPSCPTDSCCSKDEFKAALEDPTPLFIDCFATWCGPCKQIAPHIVALSNEHTGMRFYKLDVDEVPDVAQELGVRAMPTFILFKDGEKIGEIVGANKEAINAAVLQHLPSE